MSDADAEPPHARADWNRLIDDVVAGRWVDPETGRRAAVPYRRIEIAERLDGREAELVESLGLSAPYALVGDDATLAALGERVAAALRRRGAVEVIRLDHPRPDLDAAAALQRRLRDAAAASLIAVGSGSINDLCKYASAQLGLPYAVFASAATMNGYTSTTASMTLRNGLKTSLPAQAPAGVFIDLAVSAAAPPRLSQAGLGDCLCRPVAQTDWWLSHRLLGRDYRQTPFLLQRDDERELHARAALLARHDRQAIGYLQRVLTLCGLGVAFTGTSHHASMGEHQISHYIDCFAGDRHPGSLHGHQVGVAALTMARIQHALLARDEPPRLYPTAVDEPAMARRMGVAVAAQCAREYRNKALDEASAERLNRRLREIWPRLRAEIAAFAMPPQRLQTLLRAAGAPCSAAELGLPVDFYRQAVRHAHEMRDRFSFTDLACDAGLLDDLAAAEN